MEAFSYGARHKSTVFFPALLATALAGSAGCATHAPSIPTIEELRLKPSTMVVNRNYETEVLIRFTPPADLSVSELKFRLNKGAWSLQADPTKGWKIKTKTLALGEQLVVLDAKANGRKHLSGEFHIQVIEDEASVTNIGKPPDETSTPKASIVIVI